MEGNWIGHILRGESLLNEVIEGMILKKRPRGRKRFGMLNEFLKCGIKEKGRKQERMENMEAKNLPNGRTLTTNFNNVTVQICNLFVLSVQ